MEGSFIPADAWVTDHGISGQDLVKLWDFVSQVRRDAVKCWDRAKDETNWAESVIQNCYAWKPVISPSSRD